MIGRGQSACETAALLSEAGAEAEIICRGPSAGSAQVAAARMATEASRASCPALLEAPSAIGRFPLSWAGRGTEPVRVCCRRTSETLSTARSLRAGGRRMAPPAFRRVRVTSGVGSSRRARGEGMEFEIPRWPVACSTTSCSPPATGSMSPSSKCSHRNCVVDRLPRGFARTLGRVESSAPACHFVGASAVSSLGPLMRFIAGTSYAGRRASRAGLLAKRRSARRAYEPVEYGVDDVATCCLQNRSNGIL